MGELNNEVVYVGGATISIYADDPIAEDVHPTKDVDIMLRIVTFAELTALQKKLAPKIFIQILRRTFAALKINSPFMSELSAQ